ncbi:hypothetical protein [Sphingorhabdus sp. Alg239-R122]|uniref:hypothetical protein n=1 Tax=Sphingorhabdus sp. Alg239-R122 TaxID=2305989 RepID=UPI0013D8FF55|nr:hypothetical protein [Sphingorhabdus sp. Alg239-R122]
MDFPLFDVGDYARVQMNILAEFTASAGNTLAPTKMALNMKADTPASMDDWSLLILCILFPFPRIKLIV